MIDSGTGDSLRTAAASAGSVGKPDSRNAATMASPTPPSVVFASLSAWTRNARPGFLPANGVSKSSIETTLCAISRWSVGVFVPSRRWGPISAPARASKNVMLRGSLLGGRLAMLWGVASGATYIAAPRKVESVAPSQTWTKRSN